MALLTIRSWRTAAKRLGLGVVLACSIAVGQGSVLGMQTPSATSSTRPSAAERTADGDQRGAKPRKKKNEFIAKMGRFAPSSLHLGIAALGLALGASVWMSRSYPPRNRSATPSKEALRRIHQAAKLALKNPHAPARLSQEDIVLLQTFYEKWLNLKPEPRSQMREALATEGVDMLRLGEALRRMS